MSRTLKTFSIPCHYKNLQLEHIYLSRDAVHAESNSRFEKYGSKSVDGMKIESVSTPKRHTEKIFDFFKIDIVCLLGVPQ